MAFKFIGDANTSLNSAFTTNVSVTYTPTAGNLLVFAVTYGNASAKTVTLSDGGMGNTFVEIGTGLFNATAAQGTRFFYVANAVGGATTFKSTPFASSNYQAIYVAEYSGLSKVSALVGSSLREQVSPGTASNAVTSGLASVSATAPGYLMWGFSTTISGATGGPPLVGTTITARSPCWNAGGAAAYYSALPEDQRATSQTFPGTGAQTWTAIAAQSSATFHSALAVFAELIDLPSLNAIRPYGPGILPNKFSKFNPQLATSISNGAISGVAVSTSYSIGLLDTTGIPPGAPDVSVRESLKTGPGLQPNSLWQFVKFPYASFAPSIPISIFGVASSHTTAAGLLGRAVPPAGFIPSPGSPDLNSPFNLFQFNLPAVTPDNALQILPLAGLAQSTSVAWADAASSTAPISGLAISHSNALGLPSGVSLGVITGLSVSSSVSYGATLSIGQLTGVAYSMSLAYIQGVGAAFQPLIPNTAVLDVRLRVGYEPWKINNGDVIG